jgi:phosphonate transport system ATP-binding protein
VASGQIILDDDEITAMSDTQINLVRRQIGFIWQEYNLVDRVTAMRNVLSGRLGYNRGLGSLVGYFGRPDREIAVRNLERVNLLNRAGLRADRLSGGEKQRVSIARAMTQQPKLILADEPVASLDPGLSWQVLADLAKVSREDNVLTIINLHQIELAKEFCDRIIGIAQGTVVFDGKPDELDQAAQDRIYHFDRPISTLSASKRAEVLN